MRELLLFRLIKASPPLILFRLSADSFSSIFVYIYIYIITRRKSDIYFTNVVMRNKVLYIDRYVDIDR